MSVSDHTVDTVGQTDAADRVEPDVETDVAISSDRRRLPVPEAPLDLSIPHRLHVVGVGGPGMSAIAIALAEMGHDVSGSDLRSSPVLDRVRAAGVAVDVGHDRSNVHGVDAVTASTGVPDRNVELDEARSVGIPVLRRAGMLASICAQAKSIAVAGTHGKTTTTSMLMLILAEAGMRPSFVVGGDVSDVGTGAQWTRGEWLVVEADESDGTHLELPLHGSVLTNVDRDHLDLYETFDGVVDAFDRYLAQVPGPLVVCSDDPVGLRLARRHGATTYGTTGDADVRVSDIEAVDGIQTFTLVGHGAIRLPLRGRYNVLNAAGAAAMALELGADFVHVKGALERFGGVARRFDVRGTDGGATFVDDYAHVPTEIAEVLRAASDDPVWSRTIAVFQPNRFHRIAAQWHEYGSCFDDADLVVLTDIYASGTTPIPGVTGKLIVNAVTETDPTKRVVWLPERRDLVDFVAAEARDGDVVVSMGCGDIASFPSEVLDARRRR
ncbi:MAG: UDP-N-acetylmuramate--L-alanine ligase [Actinomycetota bacterium]